MYVYTQQSSLAATVPLLSTEYHIQPIDPLITETPIADRVNVIAMLQQLVNQAVELAMNTASTLQDYIVNMLQMFTDRLQDAQHNANKFLDDMQTNVNETLQRYGDVGNCVKDNIAMVQNVTTTARQDIENCVRDAQAAVIFLREDLQQYTNAIAENVARIQEIVSKCSEASSNSFDVAFCVIDHVKIFFYPLREIFMCYFFSFLVKRHWRIYYRRR